MPDLPSHAADMPRSGIREVMDAVWRSPDPVIALHVGEPSFPTPDHVLAGAQAALERHETRYVPNAGIPPLRDAIAEKVRSRNGFDTSTEQVIVSAGGMQALYVALTATVQAGDEVLIPDPGWPNFAMAVQLLQAVPKRYPLVQEHDFLPHLADLDRHVGPRTRAIVVNSPSNPLGAVLTPTLAEELVRFADRHDLWVISDECYDAITFDMPQVSPARWDREGRVFSCFSFSKTYAMTGMRVGYLVAPQSVAAVTAAKMQEALIACVNAPAQYAALAALDGPQDCVAIMRDTYRDRRDQAIKLLDANRANYLVPQGAFYLWIEVPDAHRDVADWSLKLLHDKHVAVAPGTAFGPTGQGWVRVSLATDTEDLLEGLGRLISPG